jgi:hypothetical protein
MVSRKPDCFTSRSQSSKLNPTQSGTDRVPGPVPTMIVTGFVIAEVEFADGTLSMTRSRCSGSDADGDRRMFSNPAARSRCSA